MGAENFTLPSLEHLAGCPNEAQGIHCMLQLDLQTVSPSPIALEEGQLEMRSTPFPSKGEDIDVCGWWWDGRVGSP